MGLERNSIILLSGKVATFVNSYSHCLDSFTHAHRVFFLGAQNMPPKFEEVLDFLLHTKLSSAE